MKDSWDYIIVGGGHNGLVCANYLAKAGKQVLLLEQRSKVGGAAFTEEVFPGYHFSRFSYVLSIFRPKIIEELFPEDWKKELVLYETEPYLLLPSTTPGDYLRLTKDKDERRKSLTKYSSAKDAQAYEDFSDYLLNITKSLYPLLDKAPIESIGQLLKAIPSVRLPKNISTHELVGFLSSSSADLLNRWFDSERLKAAFSYSSTVGEMQSPYDTGSAYLQLHHVASTLGDEEEKSRFYPRGGMGALTQYLGTLAERNGVTIKTDTYVERIEVENNRVVGVTTKTGETFHAERVVSNASYEVTFNQLMDPAKLPEKFQKEVNAISYSSNCAKINLVLTDIPKFTCLEGKVDFDAPFEQRVKQASLIMNQVLMAGEHMQNLHTNYLHAQQGAVCPEPTVQMLLPSLLDDSLTPENSTDIVALLFTEYAPYDIEGGWSEENRKKYIDNVFAIIEKYAPGFTKLVKHVDALFPPDIERITNLTGGNIFQGSMALNRIYANRPFSKQAQYKTPVEGLYSCSAANHPGGGVSGAPGRNSAKAMLADK